MNPFTESTVARPWAEKACSKFAGAARVARAGRRRRMLSALGVLASGVALHGMALAIDVNAATPEQLREIRGIGPKMAQVIIEERARGGRYESLDDLSDRVKGIGPKKAAAMQASGLTVGAGMVTRQGAADSVPPSGRPVASAAAKPGNRPASTATLPSGQRPRGK